MSVTHRLCGRACAIVLGCCLAIANYAEATDHTWTGTNSNDWSDANNWTNGVPVAGDSAIFSSLAAGASSTPTIGPGEAVDLGSLLFSAGAPAYQLNVAAGTPSSPGSLTLSGSGISISSSVLQTLNIDGTLRFLGNANGATAAGITNAGAFFDISGLSTIGTTLGSIAGGGDYILGGKNLIVGSNNTATAVSGIISGTNSTLTKIGTGTLTLSGANTFSGGFVLSQGGVNVNNNTSALGTGVFSVFDGRVGSTNNSAVIPNPTSIGGDFELSPVNNVLAEIQFGGPVNLGANLRQLSTLTHGPVRFSNVIAGAGGGLSLRVVGNVTGTFSFTGNANNTYTGLTSVAGNGTGGTVTLLLGKSGSSIAIAGNLEIAAGGIVNLIQGGQFASTSSVSVLASGLFDLQNHGTLIGSLNGDGSVLLSNSSIFGGTLRVGGGNFSGVISGLGNLSKEGAGSIILSGSNTFSGTTSVWGGTLIAANSAGSATGFSEVKVQLNSSLAGGNPTGTVGFIYGSVVFRNGDDGTLTPGLTPATPGTLTFNADLTLSSETQILMQLRAPNSFFSPHNDLAIVVGKLDLDGTLVFDTINGFGGPGDYLLFTHSGLTDNGLKIGTPPTGYSASDFSIDLSHPGQVILHVVPEPSALTLVLIITILVAPRRSRR